MGYRAPMLEVRRATAADSPAVASVYLDAFRATYGFPLAHADEEVRRWIAEHVVGQLETWLAVDAGAVVAFVALGDRTVEQLYVTPSRTGGGIGAQLLDLAKRRRPGGLELWTFQVNAAARRFYRRHGFREVELGDGSGNEEGQPDVRLAWPAGG